MTRPLCINLRTGPLRRLLGLGAQLGRITNDCRAINVIPGPDFDQKLTRRSIA